MDQSIPPAGFHRHSARARKVTTPEQQALDQVQTSVAWTLLHLEHLGYAVDIKPPATAQAPSVSL
jgi:hypothetical protein